jgi:hypothetical protein
MTCDRKCPDCDCLNGEAMNNITPTLSVRAAIATDDDMRALVRVAKGKPACLDCGQDHLPRPCIECENCSQLFFMKDIRTTLDEAEDKAFWCATCLEHRFDGEKPVAGVKEQMEFGWLTNE